MALLVVLLGYAAARLPARALWETLRPLLWVLLPLTAFQVLVAGWERAAVIIGVIVALVLLACLFTLTTRTTDLVDVVVRVARATRLPGVDPERVGLMLDLAIRSVPLVIELAAGVREAQHARGQAASARAFTVPLIVGALRRAEQLGDALATRGADDLKLRIGHDAPSRRLGGSSHFSSVAHAEIIDETSSMERASGTTITIGSA